MIKRSDHQEELIPPEEQERDCLYVPKWEYLLVKEVAAKALQREAERGFQEAVDNMVWGEEKK